LHTIPSSFLAPPASESGHFRRTQKAKLAKRVLRIYCDDQAFLSFTQNIPEQQDEPGKDSQSGRNESD